VTTDSVQQDKISALAETIMQDLPGWVRARTEEGVRAKLIADAGGLDYFRMKAIAYCRTAPKREDAIALAKGWIILNAGYTPADPVENLDAGIKEVEATPEWVIQGRYRATLDEYTRQWQKLQDSRRVPDSEWFKGASLCLKR